MADRKSSSRILVIDDQSRTADLLARLAPDLAFLEVGRGTDEPRLHARFWRDAESFFQGTRRRPPDLVLLDLRFDVPDEELLPDRKPLGDGAAARRIRQDRRDRQGLFILERLRSRYPDLSVILTTAHEDIPFEEEALRLRADAFTYTVGEEETTGEGLLRIIRRALAEREAPLLTGKFFWGKSPAIRELRRRVLALAPTPLPLLVTGPTGTGKNLLVREVIHPASGRKGPFVPFDCATVPESLLQAALFGTVRGAFTGAVVDRPGVFEAARDGTLFLDEIENLTVDAQKTLLTALNDGVIRRLGSTAEVPHSARVVAASNIDLSRRVAEGTFRPDLLMRLNPALALELPPLRDRREDLTELADLAADTFFQNPAHRRQILSRVRAAGGPEPTTGRFELARQEGALSKSEAPVIFCLPRKAWTAMSRHPWPGNVRQFDMVLTDILASALYGGVEPAMDRKGRAIFSVEARLVFDLLAGAREAQEREQRWIIPRPKATSVSAFRRELERSVFRMLFEQAEGDFERMAEWMTGSSRQGRAARLRFNRLGLSARERK